MVSEESDVPFGYQLLVPGSNVAVPISWLGDVLHKLRKKEPTIIVKKIVDGLLQPWEIGQKGGTEALLQTKWQPVLKALQSNFSFLFLFTFLCTVQLLL